MLTGGFESNLLLFLHRKMHASSFLQIFQLLCYDVNHIFSNLEYNEPDFFVQIQGISIDLVMLLQIFIHFTIKL